MNWREEVEEIMRAAASSLRCGPLPSVIRMAIPTPIGRTVKVCPARVSAKALMQLHSVLVITGRLSFSARQRDVLWSRAFDLSWKEIGKFYPRVSGPTLRREYDSAIDEIWKQLSALPA